MSKFTFIEEIAEHAAISPATFFTHGTRVLDEITANGYDFQDPNNPLINLMEISAIQVAGLMQKTDVVTRKRYPRLAQTLSDLYPHMTSEEFSGIWGSPIRNHIITLGLGYVQVGQYAVYNPVTGLNEIVIPRDTVFTGNGYSFTIHQPLIISVFPNGDIRVNFDSTVSSPILERETNLVDTRIGYFENTKFLLIDIPCDQLNIISANEPVTATRSWNVTAEIEDYFFYARGYYKEANGPWVEMQITHDTDSYDPVTPTMVIEVEDSIVRCSIPDVFIERGQVGALARVDIYTTKGETSIDLSGLEMSEWEVTWNDFSGLSVGYLAPLQEVTSRLIYSTQISNGGTNGQSFEEVRESVIYSDYGKRGAYTDEELVSALAKYGYQGSLRKDTLTDRVYIASRSVDTSASLALTGLSSGIGIVNEPVVFYTGRDDLTYAMSVHEKRATIFPNMLYREKAGSIAPLSDTEYAELQALSKAALVDELNANLYFYTPFHMVLDYSTPIFTARSYRMTSPTVAFRNLLATNNVLGFTTYSNDVTVSYSDSGYQLKVVAARPKAVSGFKLQLVFENVEGSTHYLTANESNVLTDTMEFVFDLGSTFEIDVNGSISVMAYNSSHVLEETVMSLSQVFRCIYLVETDTEQVSSFDDQYFRDAYSEILTAITLENMKVTFGQYLEGYSMQSRPLLQAPSYQRYLSDVPDVYLENVYEQDVAGTKVYYDEATDTISFNLLHAIGDPKLDENGDVIYLHRAGDPVRDPATNDFVQTKPASLSREVRFPLFDAKALLATNENIVAYRQTIPANVVDILTRDIATLQRKVISSTKLYFEPLATQQSAEVNISSSRAVNMRTALSFAVNYQLTVSAYDDNDFRKVLRTSTIATIAKVIGSNSFSISKLISELEKLAPNKVTSITVSNPIGDTGVAVIEEPLSSFSIKKVMRLEANGRLTIDDDVDITFTR